MCGITGYVSTRNINIEPMLSVLNHRGPDSSGSYLYQTLNKTICLGHTRLSIIDLSLNGKQPMTGPNEDVIIAFNGEIYNFLLLRESHLKNTSFKSDTDTEVVLHLYLKLGIDFIKLLNGDFAISILDKRINKIYLVRDRAGVKPVYYYYKQGELIFGSEIKSILAGGIPKKIDKDEIQKYFVFKYTPAQNTLFEGVKRLQPGKFIEFDFINNDFKIISYWELKANSEYKKLSFRDAKEVFYDLTEDAVKLRLISDVPIGSFLSGGLDSSILAYFLKDRSDILHYCAGKSKVDLKKEGTTSDMYYARKLAEEWQLNLRGINISADEANSEQIASTIYYSDDLIADGSQIPSYLITKEAAKTSKVIISGMGADEMFLGYAGHQITLISNYLDMLPKSLSGAIAKKLSGLNQGKGSFLAYKRYLHKFGKYYLYPKYKYGIMNIVGDFENSCSIYKGNKEDTVSFISSYFDNDDVFKSLADFESENFLVKNLHYMDRMSMANSVEGRVPFLDHRLMEFAYSIDRSYKLSAFGKSKRIMKEAFEDKLPHYILNRRKAGFGMPLRSIFSDRNKINTLLDASFFGNFENFSLESIEKIINNHLKGKEDNSSIIYALISFQKWYNIHIAN